LEYVSRKITLLTAAGITEETVMKRMSWEGLDANLAFIEGVDRSETLMQYRRPLYHFMSPFLFERI
jgi:hypothetical protein